MGLANGDGNENTQRPLVSVVIPSYNCGRWVGQAVESALAQTCRPIQVIVVDDGSTDDTQKVLEGYVGRVECVYQKNQGVSAARNAGISRARGDLIAFLDADDVWHPQKLEIQIAVLARRPDIGMLGTGVFEWPNEQADQLECPDEPVADETPWSALVIRNYFTTSSVVVRRSLLEIDELGAFDTALQGPEDYDLWLRIAEKSKVAKLRLPLTGYRSRPGSLGNQAVSMELGMSRILKKLDGRGVWNGISGRLLRRKAQAYVNYSCAYMHGADGNEAAAVLRVLRSILGYPLPFGREEVSMHFARPKLLGTLILRLLALKRPAHEK